MGFKIHRYPDLSGPLYFYRGEVALRFSLAHWLYLLEGVDGSLTPCFGTTKVLKIVDKSSALINWATRLFLEKAVALIQQHRRGEFVEVEYEDLVALLTKAKDEHKAVLEAAGDTGHSAHHFVESLVKATMADDETRRLEILSKFPEDERAMNAAIAAVCFFVDHNVRYVTAEQRVYHREWNVAGTLDGDVYIDSCERLECSCQEFAPFKDKRLVLDLKTSNQIQATYFAQAALYRAAKEMEFPEVKFDGTVILRMGKDDSQEFEPFFTFGDKIQAKHLAFFKHALDLTVSVTDAEESMRRVKEARREKIKAEKAAQVRIRCPKADGYKGYRKSKCFEDGSQCEACKKIYEGKHGKDH